MVYLDYSAHTPADPRVLKAYLETEACTPGNANSHHAAGRASLSQITESLSQIADLLGVLPEEIIPVSGASEANNLAIKGVCHANRHIGRHILSTAMEHASVSASLSVLQEQGWEIDLVPVTRSGIIDLDPFRELLRKDTVLVAVSLVDSELGTLQPVREIQELLRAFPQCRLHIDATQAVGKCPVDFTIGDTISFSPHKFYGLNGSGYLIKRKGVPLTPQISGGASTTIYRSGTPFPAAVAADALALSLCISELSERAEKVNALKTQLLQGLSDPHIHVNSPSGIPHIVNLSVDGIRGKDMQAALDERGICVSVKSACSVDLTPSRAVMAVTRDRKRAFSSFRVSLSHLTTEEEIRYFLTALNEISKEHAV